jgi:hypothetical protein
MFSESYVTEYVTAQPGISRGSNYHIDRLGPSRVREHDMAGCDGHLSKSYMAADLSIRSKRHIDEITGKDVGRKQPRTTPSRRTVSCEARNGCNIARV